MIRSDRANLKHIGVRRGHGPAGGLGRGFTLVELMIASIITVFVLSSLTVSLSQLNRTKETSQLRLNAHLRADLALSHLRRDVASTIRHRDLYWTRVLIREGMARTAWGEMERDSILVYNTHLRSLHDLDFSGEGVQYETHYRVQEDETGSVLWQRRDAVPDEYPLAGGIATPIVEGIIALRIEAFDGFEWFEYWDSDERGIPHAVRLTVVASGARNGEELYDAPRATLRTVVSLDRVPPPHDPYYEEEFEEEEEEELEDVSDWTIGADRGDRDGSREGAGGRDDPRGSGGGQQGGVTGQPGSPGGAGGRGGSRGGRSVPERRPR